MWQLNPLKLRNYPQTSESRRKESYEGGTYFSLQGGRQQSSPPCPTVSNISTCFLVPPASLAMLLPKEQPNPSPHPLHFLKIYAYIKKKSTPCKKAGDKSLLNYLPLQSSLTGSGPVQDQQHLARLHEWRQEPWN